VQQWWICNDACSPYVQQWWICNDACRILTLMFCWSWSRTE
jgi:hypothetical protein